MIYSTTETIPSRDIIESLGVVTGNVVQAKHIGRDIMAGLKSIVGGEIRGYTEMLNELGTLQLSGWLIVRSRKVQMQWSAYDLPLVPSWMVPVKF